MFFLGGSTTFGYDLPDYETVPSFFQQLQPEIAGKKTRAYNFGRSDYFSTNERILLEQLLASGLHPDLVIVMDGLNEFSSDAKTRPSVDDSAPSFFRHFGRLIAGQPMFRLASNLKDRLVKEKTTTEADNPDESRIESTLTRYVANKRAMGAVADSFGLTAAFVWHPVPTYRYDLRFHPFARSGWQGLFITRKGYERAAEQVQEGLWGQHLVWCADIQAGAREPLYVDRWHYTAKFSREVAGCIIQGLVAQHLLAS
jgi:lysophospholipase L1-like esterase